MCLHYRPENNLMSNASRHPNIPDSLIDIANIIEVRTGFSTDTFNEVEKLPASKRPKMADNLKPENCFSIVFDHNSALKPLDLVARDKDTCQAWVQAIDSRLDQFFAIFLDKNIQVIMLNTVVIFLCMELN